MRMPAILATARRPFDTMEDALVAAHARLSPRERWLLAGLLAGVLPLALLVFWVLPLLAGLERARSDLAEARATRLWIQERAAEARALGTPPPAAEGASPAPVGISRVEQSLIDAGLRTMVTTLANGIASERAPAGIDLGFDAVPFVELAGWLDRAIGGSGYVVEMFRFEARPEPGLIRAEIRLTPAGN